MRAGLILTETRRAWLFDATVAMGRNGSIPLRRAFATAKEEVLWRTALSHTTGFWHLYGLGTLVPKLYGKITRLKVDLDAERKRRADLPMREAMWPSA